MSERTVALIHIGIEVTQEEGQRPHVSARVFTTKTSTPHEFEATPESVNAFLESVRALIPTS